MTLLTAVLKVAEICESLWYLQAFGPVLLLINMHSVTSVFRKDGEEG
jgi:hypothetical protein